MEKRHYRNGFYVQFRHEVNPLIAETLTRSHVENDQNATSPASVKSNAALLESPCADSTEERHKPIKPAVSKVDKKPVHPTLEKVDDVRKPKDEQPADIDHPNKTLLIVILIAVIIALCGLLIFVPGMSAFLVALFRFFPAIALILFIAALMKRHKILRAAVAGANGDEYRLSKMWDRFALPLYLFFGAAAAVNIGWLLLILFGAGPLVFFGGILIESGIILGLTMTIFLVALCIMYLIRWRKQGDNRKPGWVKRPKDG